jgi:hypothetical protein
MSSQRVSLKPRNCVTLKEKNINQAGKMRTIKYKKRISYGYQEGIGLSFAAAENYRAAAPKKFLSLLGID